jgi:hypothetical protein
MFEKVKTAARPAHSQLVGEELVHSAPPQRSIEDFVQQKGVRIPERVGGRVEERRVPPRGQTTEHLHPVLVQIDDQAGVTAVAGDGAKAGEQGPTEEDHDPGGPTEQHQHHRKKARC